MYQLTKLFKKNCGSNLANLASDTLWLGSIRIYYLEDEKKPHII